MGNETESDGSYQLITPPNVLKARVGAGVGIDVELVKRAYSAVKTMQSDFLQRVDVAVGEISDQIIFVEKFGDENGKCAAEIIRISQVLQNQGVAFGYPLVSDVFHSLCDYLANPEAPESLLDKVVLAHINVLKSITGNSISGDGGQVGRDLVESLNVLVSKSVG